jgi:phosphopantothenoylcysteine decarboxylase/phosphopantothenate--cysteine ligase
VALIVLGVTGGIGAYKAVEVCRGLQRRGHDVVAVMTKAATRFVGPLTFEAITRRPVITSQWKPGANADIEHIAIADDLALLLVAPCTANVIGKFANGIADDFLSSLYLATTAPVVIAPAMNTNMLAHDAVQRNLQALAARGVRVVEPGEGYLACGWIGKGRLAEPDDIVDAAERIVSPRDSALRGRRVVVTAGPTYEDIDPVRYVGNRSSGRMGFAIAAAAHARGANVTLVAGPTAIEPPRADQVIRVRRAVEMHESVMRAAEHADVVIMAAAVADYSPVSTAPEKITKSDAPLTLTLQRTPDILADLGRLSSRRATPLILVGFAAETGDLLPKARAKRTRKNADLIVANDVTEAGAGFEVDTNVVTIIGANEEQTLPLQSKARVADAILDRVEQLLRTRTTAGIHS